MDFGLAHDAPVKLYEANKGRAPIVKDHRLHAAQKENVGLHLRILPLCVCVWYVMFCCVCLWCGVCAMWWFVVHACGVVCGVLLCVPVLLCVCYVVCAFGVMCVYVVWCVLVVVCVCFMWCDVCVLYGVVCSSVVTMCE